MVGVTKSVLNEILDSDDKHKCENQKKATIKNLAFIELIRELFSYFCSPANGLNYMLPAKGGFQ